MIESGGGAIVNVSSISALRPRGLTAYSTSKGAVIALTRAMAVDHGREGIRVNCVAPGPVYTPMVGPTGIDEAASLGPVLQAFGDAGVRDQPVDNLLGNNNAPFEPARTSFDWLSRDGDEVDRYIADPMCGDDNPLTYGYLIDLFDVVAPARDQLASIRCPVLVIAGDHDPAAAMGVHATTLAHVLEAQGVDVDVALYEGARHELLNEINRDQVTTDIIGWLQSRA